MINKEQKQQCCMQIFCWNTFLDFMLCCLFFNRHMSKCKFRDKYCNDQDYTPVLIDETVGGHPGSVQVKLANAAKLIANKWIKH